MYRVGYFVGSLSSTSINRILSRALIRLAPEDLEFSEIPIGDLPLYSPDFDSDYPPEALALKDAITRSEAVLFVTPEYNRSIPGALKNAIDWASRPWGHNSFDHMPAAVIGASPGQIGTAVGQQSLRAVLGFCNARQMTAPEAYIHFPASTPGASRRPRWPCVTVSAPGCSPTTRTASSPGRTRDLGRVVPTAPNVVAGRSGCGRGHGSVRIQPGGLRLPSPRRAGGDPAPRSAKAEIDGDLVYFNWADHLDPGVLKGFQKEYGVKIIESNVDSMEGMNAKIAAGNQYDIIFPVAKWVVRMRREGKLRAIDHHQLSNADQVFYSGSCFADPWYDPHSRVSVPFTVYKTGIGWRTDKIETMTGSWRDLWSPQAGSSPSTTRTRRWPWRRCCWAYG